MSENKRKVYVVQDSPGKNLEPARKFGEIEVILGAREESTEKSIFLLAKSLTMIQHGDSLLLIGNPLYIGVAMHVALTALNGKLGVLVWDRKHYDYIREVVEI